MYVIAKAYGGEPLRRIATGHAHGLTYVVNPEAVENAEVAPLSGVGFPDAAVFAFDESLFVQLRVAWESRAAAALKDLWRMAEPIVEAA